MKKIVIFLFVLVLLIGCNNTTTQQNPGKIAKSYVEENFPTAQILSQKTEKDYYLTLIEYDNTVSLIIFENKDGEYKWFGASSYDSTRQEYGSYIFTQYHSLVIIYSKNEKMNIKNLEVHYENADHQDEKLIIKDKIEELNFIKVYMLPSNYAMKSIRLNES